MNQKTSAIAIAALASVIVLGLGGLGIYALHEGINNGRKVHFAQGFMLLLVSAFGFRALAKFWLSIFWRQDDNDQSH